MPQREIEVILTRQLAGYLALPVFIVDPEGSLIFYNEPAEIILGRRFDETGEMSASEWATLFRPTDADGVPLQPAALPLMIALRERRLVHGELWIRGLDDVRRHIQTAAFPLIGPAARHLGAVAIFQEAGSR